MQQSINSKPFAILLPALVGLGGAMVSVRGFEQYGWSLFVGLPVVVTFLSAFAWSFRRRVSFGSAYGIACLSILALGGFILCFALDGLICLLMALPLALALAVIGSGLGWFLGSSLGAGVAAGVSALVSVCFPLLVGFEHATIPEPAIREVTTSVEIDAPIEAVWEAVIAFPRITEPPEGIFRLGIAYPIEARIEGEGVGAVRYCTFSTGSFVEPITVWDRPRALAFDVTENPPPMREFSIYEDLQAPHLHGHMQSERGQFRLSERGGRVVLEGTTWYSHSLAPQFYWGMVSDEIIHRIHLRVLEHIKRHSESP